MVDAISVEQSTPVPSHQGLMRVVDNKTLDEQEAANRKAQEAETEPVIQTISTLVEELWQDNQNYKTETNIDHMMLASLRQRNNEYDSDKIAAILEQGGTQIFLGLTGVKCRGAEAWISDVLAPTADKPWTLEPTPIPDLPHNVEEVITNNVMAEFQASARQGQPIPPNKIFEMAQNVRTQVEEEMEDEADERAKRMELKIEDGMVSSGWANIFDDLLVDIVTLKAGILKGPIVRKKEKLGWKRGAGGKTSMVIKEEISLELERVSPFDIFPSRGQVDFDDGDFIERMKLSRKSLSGMKGVPGYRDDAIDLVLSEYEQGLFRRWTDVDAQRAELEDKGSDILKQRGFIEAIECWMSVQGQLLLREDITEDPDGNVILPLTEYEVNVIKVGEHLVYLAFNPDPLGKRPYSKTGFAAVPGSFWYMGVPELMKDLQSICNAAGRALVNNMGIASGPQVAITDINRLPPGENIESMYAWRIWQFTNQSQITSDPIRFFNVPSNAAELMAVYNAFARMADDYTGIPAYALGNPQISGAGRTSSGLAMLMGSAARGIKKVISRIDQDVIRPVVTREFNWYMMFDPDETIKGDVEIKASGILSLLIKEQAEQARANLLQATNNPTDLAIMGHEGRGNLLREQAKAVDVPEHKLVPKSEDELKAMDQAASQAQAQQDQIEQAKDVAEIQKQQTT